MPCLIRILCKDVRVPPTLFFDRLTTVTKSTYVALIKDMDKPLYKAETSLPSLSVPITMGPPPATLSLEGDSTAPPTIEATEQPKGEIMSATSTPVTIGLVVTVPYSFLEKLVTDNPQTRALLDQVIERLPRVV